MSTVGPSELAEILGVRSRRSKPWTSLDLAARVGQGLPVRAMDRLCLLLAPGDAKLRHSIVPKATLARRQRTASRRLSPEESDRLTRLARLWALAVEIWGSPAEAQRFLGEAHPLLAGRVPLQVAIETEIGARTVEELLGRLKFGSAA